MSQKILIADDEPLFRQTTGELLETVGYSCTCVSNAVEALKVLRMESVDLILSDLNMPGNEELQLLLESRLLAPRTPLIVITGVPSLPTAIESIRLGIADYLLKPVKFHDLLASIQRVLAVDFPHGPESRAIHETKANAARRYPELVGESHCMLELFDIIERLSGSDANVLISGESGTGKEVVAKIIHQNSFRSSHAFQVIDCTAIPDTLFESILFGHVKGAFTGAIKDQEGLLSQAHLGTVFLDEVGELPKTQQAKLLRVIQEQTYYPVGSSTPEHLNTRFLCATNRDLESEIKLGNFRRDLFYRLAVVHLAVPPLRQRGEDIALLIRYFENKLQAGDTSAKYFSEDAIERFRRYSWPGNVRELRNVIEHCFALCRERRIEFHQLPKPLLVDDESSQVPDMVPLPARARIIESAERQYFVDLLTRHGGNVTRAAVEAQMSRQGLHKLLRKHKITAATYRI